VRRSRLRVSVSRGERGDIVLIRAGTCFAEDIAIAKKSTK
jgi:hypothetical protein